jgi:hypothetical protein
MNAPYSHIGEATRESAILTNAGGYDVAVIERATVRAPGLTAEHHLTGEEWQRIINLVDAAPDLLAALSACLDSMTRQFPVGLPVQPGTHSEEQDWNQAVRSARAAITRATNTEGGQA